MFINNDRFQLNISLSTNSFETKFISEISLLAFYLIEMISYNIYVRMCIYQLLFWAMRYVCQSLRQIKYKSIFSQNSY